MLSQKNVLVLGSKPDSVLPDLQVSSIYAANGAAERAKIYKEKYPKTPLICCAGASEFARNENVKSRIIDSNPQKIVVRMGQIDLPSNLINTCKLICLSTRKQWTFQKKFFQFKSFSLLSAELRYGEKFFQRVLHFLKCIKNKKFQGVSTGFFSILLALEENPDSNIIVSGIGMTGGHHFYQSERSKFFNYSSRARVDGYLVKKIDEILKKKIISLDKELVNLAKFEFWKGKVF